MSLNPPPVYERSSRSEDEILVKGTPVITLLRFVAHELTREQKATAYGRLPAEDVAKFERRLLASDLIPLATVNQLTVAAANAKGEPIDEFAVRAGRFGAKEALGLVFRPFFRAASIQHSLKIAPLMWGQIYVPASKGGSIGKMTVKSEPAHAVISVTDFPSTTPGCARALGWFTYIGEFSGAKDIRLAHPVCMVRGASECQWEATWAK